MKRGVAVLLLIAGFWALGSTWYYDCKIKRVCGPDDTETLTTTAAVPVPAEPVAVAATAVTAPSPAAVETTEAIQLDSQPAAAITGPLVVMFDARSAAILPPPDVAARLDALRQGVAAGQKILVRGHSDGRGARERIALVSRQRAESLRDWLLTQGFAADAIAGVESREDRDPIANNGQAEGRAKNRRAEALLVSPP